eukprot:SAG22_NODE_5705_length_964_cov_1.642117_1_plen_257_part_01
MANHHITQHTLGHRRRGFDRHYLGRLGRARAGAQGLSPPGGAGRAYALPASAAIVLGVGMKARATRSELSQKNHEFDSLQSLLSDIRDASVRMRARRAAGPPIIGEPVAAAPRMSPPSAQGLQLSLAEGVLNLFKGSLGPGCLSLPFAVSRAGVLLAPAEMAVLMLCCVYNMHLMVSVKQTLVGRPATAHVSTYGDCGEAVFGPRYGRKLIEFFVTLQQLGVRAPPLPAATDCQRDLSVFSNGRAPPPPPPPPPPTP